MEAGRWVGGRGREGEQEAFVLLPCSSGCQSYFPHSLLSRGCVTASSRHLSPLIYVLRTSLPFSAGGGGTDGRLLYVGDDLILRALLVYICKELISK